MKTLKQNQHKEITERLTFVINHKVTSKKEFAHILNVAPTTVSAWTSGRIFPSIKLFIKIAILTHTSLDWLLLGKENSSEPIDEQLFNEVCNLGYKLAQKHNLTISGSYFLGIYSLVIQELRNNPKITPKQAIENNQKMIIQLRQ